MSCHLPASTYTWLVLGWICCRDRLEHWALVLGEQLVCEGVNDPGKAVDVEEATKQQKRCLAHQVDSPCKVESTHCALENGNSWTLVLLGPAQAHLLEDPGPGR